MVAHFYQITPEQLSDFLRRPSEAYDYVHGPFFHDPKGIAFAESVIAQARKVTEGLPPGFRAQVERVAAQINKKTAAAKGPQLVKRFPEPERREFSLEKDWHVLHYALNGTKDGGSGPLPDAILGGHEIPDVEGVTSFGAADSPMRYLTVEEVRSISASLAQVDPGQLLSRLNFEDAMAKQIYLSHTLDDLEKNWYYLPELFQSFRGFYSQAADSGRAMLLSII